MMLLAIIILILQISDVCSSQTSNIVIQKVAGSMSERERVKKVKLLPKLIPHPDTSYILEFIADGYSNFNSLMIKLLFKMSQIRSL